MILPGVLAARPAAGPAPYHADAVHFDGSTWLINAALAAADGKSASVSVWLKATTPSGVMVPWSVDPEGDYLSYFTWGNPSASDLEAIFSGPISGPNDFITSAPGVGPNDIWFNELVSVDTSTTPPRMACYITGVAFGNPPNTHGGADYVVPFNGLPLWVGADSFDDNYTGDMADLWIAPGVSLLDGGGAIPLATRNHFIDAFGKPVNPSVYTGLYGGAVLLSGNAAGFATNQLAGGAFTTTGALTNASSSPSD